MQQDAAKLSNVVLFEEIADGVTRIQSFGIGYTDAPEYDRLMGFFVKGNESLYQNLRAYLETGERADWSQYTTTTDQAALIRYSLDDCVWPFSAARAWAKQNF